MNGCKRLGEANRRTLRPIARGIPGRVLPLDRVRAMQSQAMGNLNRLRAALRKAEKHLAAARVALAALVA